MKRTLFFTLTTGLTLLTCVGCSTQTWTRPGLTQAEWQADSYACERDARMSAMSFGGGIAGAMEARDFRARCLTAKGYQRVD